MVVRLSSRLNRGTDFAKAAICLAKADGKRHVAFGAAADRWGADHPAARMLAKAAVTAETAADWRPGDDPEDAAAEFFAAARDRSLLGQLQGVRPVGFNSRIIVSAEDAAATWVEEGKAAPLTAPGGNSFLSLPTRKVAALVVATEESLDVPGAELWLREQLLSAVATGIDRAILDGAAGTDARPASITYGLTPSFVSTDPGEILHSLASDYGGDLSRAVIVAHPRTLAAAWDPLAAPDIGPRGGTLGGVPTIASQGAPEGRFTMLDPTALAVAGAGGDVAISRHGSIEMADDPSADSTTPTASTTVSMWQTNSLALGVWAYVNWRSVRPGAVAVFDTAFTGGAS